jgi:hypothetical protein
MARGERLWRVLVALLGSLFLGWGAFVGASDAWLGPSDSGRAIWVAYGLTAGLIGVALLVVASPSIVRRRVARILGSVYLIGLVVGIGWVAAEDNGPATGPPPVTSDGATVEPARVPPPAE